MLEIIPVIDIRGGIVVHARGGDRRAYAPLQSRLTTATSVSQVMADLLSWWPFPRVYIADLDAIEQGAADIHFYRQLCQQFSDVEIWLDSGVQNRTDLMPLLTIDGLRPVVGSETLQSLELLVDASCSEKLVLSLDRRGGAFLGQQALLEQPAIWPSTVIVMSLDHVGANQGPALEWLGQLRRQREDVAWYLAGGVRGKQDLLLAEENSATGVLIASALHTGALSRQDFTLR